LAREEGLAETSELPAAIAFAEKESQNLQNEPDVQLLLQRVRGMLVDNAKEAS
jgi:hypothetical protein